MQYPVQFIFNGSYYTCVFVKINGSATLFAELLVTSITPHGKGVPAGIHFVSNRERTLYTSNEAINAGFSASLLAACLSECKNHNIPEF